MKLYYKTKKYVTLCAILLWHSLKEGSKERKRLNFFSLTAYLQGKKRWKSPYRNGTKVLSAISGMSLLTSCFKMHRGRTWRLL